MLYSHQSDDMINHFVGPKQASDLCQSIWGYTNYLILPLWKTIIGNKLRANYRTEITTCVIWSSRMSRKSVMTCYWFQKFYIIGFISVTLFKSKLMSMLKLVTCRKYIIDVTYRCNKHVNSNIGFIHKMSGFKFYYRFDVILQCPNFNKNTSISQYIGLCKFAIYCK